MHADGLLWSWLHVLSRERFQALQDVYGDLESAAEHLSEELLLNLGCRRETVEKVMARAAKFNASSYSRSLEKEGITFLSLSDPSYSALLREAADAPPFLYAKGDLSLLSQPCVALVGTRKMTTYGRRAVEEFVPGLVRAGIVTVSGLARGIDGEVARSTMHAGGGTVAVLAHGLGMMYPPSHRKLAAQILDCGGLLLSEFPLDMPPDTYTFPARNRIIAGLSLATVVLEAPRGSGALITAGLALEYGREVFAVPGQIFDPNFVGCHALIASARAKLACGSETVLRDIGIVSGAAMLGEAGYEPQSPDEHAVLSSLTAMPQPADDLVEKSRLDPGRMRAALTVLELEGRAKNVGGGMWVKN